MELLGHKLKKNGKLPQFYWRRCHKKGIFMKLEYCFGLELPVLFVIENNGYGLQHQQMSKPM
jgi:hypothetical protein